MQKVPRHLTISYIPTTVLAVTWHQIPRWDKKWIVRRGRTNLSIKSLQANSARFINLLDLIGWRHTHQFNSPIGHLLIFSSDRITYETLDRTSVVCSIR